MSTMKRCISLLLVLGILLGILAPAAQAAPVEEHATVDTSDVNIVGTNGFGNLLAQEVAENQQETEMENEDYPGGYSVTDLEIVDNVATVTYDSMEEATLVVALHTEDGMQLLTSATATVTPDATVAAVTFEGEMPEYFMASAYLLDQYDYSPLCASYDTPMYTREMQELLASTVDDYAPEKVLNLDEDETTNFAVYADSTIVIEPVKGKNTVESIDDENAVYVIKNADAQITSLTEGSVFVYPYAENEILIIKVASISLDGTTATITGAELEMNDVFSYVKIESSADASKAVVHEGTGDDCVTYNGVQYNSVEMNGQESQYQPNAWEDDITLPMPSLEFGIEETFEDAEGNKIVISGGMKIEADISFQYYIALFSQYVKFQIDTTVGLNYTVAGTVELFEFELPEIDFDLIPQLVSVGSKPQVEVSFNGEIGWEGNVHFTVGFAIGHNVPKQDLCTGPWVESKTNLKVGFAVKIDLQPNLSAKATDFLELISARVTCPVGLELTAEETGQSWVDAYGDQGSSIHTCQNCLKFELFGCIELGAEIVFLDKVKLINKGDGLSITLPFKAKAKVPILSAYYSATYDDFGFGSCPYESYRLTIKVLDSADHPVQNTSVYTTRESWGNTNKHGILATYVPEGTYELYTVIENEEVAFSIQIDGPDYIQVMPNKDTILDNMDSEKTLDLGVPVYSGSCGENIEWALYSNGLLHISGYGKMKDYYTNDTRKYPPWHRWYASEVNVVTVVIEDGITYIGDCAFYDNKFMTNVSIPNTVTSIGFGAFEYCPQLTDVVIPSSVTYMEDAVFQQCHNLCNVTISNSLTKLPAYTFSGCKKLTNITIPDGITSLGSHAFAYCNELTSITIPDSVQYIQTSAFESCTKLSTVNIGCGVTSIGWSAFAGCNKLESIFFAGDAPDIGYDAFRDISASAFYPVNNPTWTPDVMQNYYGNITWIPYMPNNRNVAMDEMTEIPQRGAELELEAVYGGEYSTEITWEAVTKTASFSGLVPGEQYVLLAMSSIEVADPLAADNLLAIDQGVASEDGTLSFQYIQHTLCDISYVFVCGASNKNLNDAEIVFPEMVADGELQVVDPVVVYDGKTLTEGRDYVITGTVDYTEVGEYTCYIRGIRNYTGLVECSYTVKEAELGNPFTDVPEGTFYYEPVMWAIENGITNGTSATTFGPNDQCMRAHVVTFLWRTVGSPEPKLMVNPFVDVKPTDFYYKPVLWALENGITSGMDATHFGPTSYCNRAQVVTFLYRTMGNPDVGAATNPFTDVAAGSFYERAVLWAVENGVTAGLSATSFGPNSICNRAQIVTFLYRAFVD